MRYSYTALALALATATQVTAHPRLDARHGHAAFHAKRDAEAEKRTDWSAALANVDWSEALEGVDWSTVAITYSTDQTFGATSAAAAPPSSTAAAVTTSAPVVSHAAVEQSSTLAPASTTTRTTTAVPTTAAPTTTLVTSAAPTSVSSAQKAAATTASSGGDLVSSILNTVEEAAIKALGVLIGGNAVSGSDADIWIGSDGKYTMDINNAADEDLVLVAWDQNGGSWIGAKAPLITLQIPSGGSTTLSFNDQTSGALGAFYGGLGMSEWGQLDNTWVEFTMSEQGVFDVSREVNMNGRDVEVVHPSCTSNMNTCVFTCKSGNTCMDAGTYQLENCTNKGIDSNGGDSGGCGPLGSTAHMTTTFS